MSDVSANDTRENTLGPLPSLDFILFLEYIEAQFYAINVPRFAVIT